MPSPSTGVPQDFDVLLTPEQQSFLFAALNQGPPMETDSGSDALGGEPSGTTRRPSSIQESPFLDNYDYFLGGDTSIDFDDSHAHMMDDIPSSKSSDAAETRDKRSHPDDDDEDGPNGSNSAKRRGSGNERIPKKPGRKPLTEEPASKRKAQNRAAQRAFRERKEKHLKDLETKVEELEKASRDANNENSVLRVQIERMTTELDEYKQRLSLAGTGRAIGRSGQSFGAAAISNLGDINFQFEFPKFGVLPGPDVKNAAAKSPSPTTRSALQQQPPSGERSPSQGAGETAASLKKPSGSPLNAAYLPQSISRASIDSALSFGATATSSPSASSNSNVGGSSSCGTSPEPFTQSPMGFKPIDTMTTIGEEQPNLIGANNAFGELAGFGTAGFDWLPHNGGHFDPQLFGDYRESQDPLLGKNFFDDNYFNDSLEADFSTPFFTPAAPPQAEKKSLIAAIDEKKNADDDVGADSGGGYSCRKIWENLQNCEMVQSGEVDMDSLCKELQQKATCKGNGPEVHEKDFDTIIKKYIPHCKTTDEKWVRARVGSPAAAKPIGAACR